MFRRGQVMWRVFGWMTCGVILLPRVAAAATEVPGGALSGKQRWTLAESPYLVQGDLTIANAAELVVEAGVEVRFANLDIAGGGLDPKRVELVVEGALRAEGTREAPVFFGAADGDFANSWSGVRVPSGAQAVTLAHVAIEAANVALDSAAPAAVLSIASCSLRKSFTGLRLVAGSPLLEKLTLESNSVSGAEVDASTADVTFALQNSVVRLNGSYGVLLRAGAAHRVRATVASSTLFGNTSAGITCEAPSDTAALSLLVQSSIVSNNGIVGIDYRVGGAPQVEIRYSDVDGNGMDLSGAVLGDGCISDDPGFVDAPWDLRLMPASPCIDRADRNGSPPDDVLGAARPSGSASDMGAYEYVPAMPGSGGEGGASTAGDGGASSSAGGDGAPEAPNVGESGCSCRIAKRTNYAGVFGAVLVITLLIRRRISALVAGRRGLVA